MDQTTSQMLYEETQGFNCLTRLFSLEPLHSITWAEG